MLRFALFDLDDTLYAHDTGLWTAIGERITQYIVDQLGLPRPAAQALREHYYLAFGTTLNGLRHDYHIDPAAYLNYVHALPLENYLRPQPALDALLHRLPLTKIIFTNADAPHARRVLNQLGLTHHFTQIVDLYALGFVNKPLPEAYQRLLTLIQAPPEACVFFEDAWRNLQPARALGMCTVLVGPARAEAEVDFKIRDILGLETILEPLARW